MSVPFGKAAEKVLKKPEIDEEGFETVYISPPIAPKKEAAPPAPIPPK